MSKLNKISVSLSCLLILAMFSNGCTNYKPKYKPAPNPCVVLNEKLSSYIITRPTAPDYVMRLDIPHSLLFNPESANFKNGAPKLLNKISTLLSCYQKEDLRVVSYLYVKPEADLPHYKSLANEQAQRVGNYLWHHDRDVRIINPYAILQESTSRNPIDFIELVFKSLN
jgi:hypothetical protein